MWPHLYATWLTELTSRNALGGPSDQWERCILVLEELLAIFIVSLFSARSFTCSRVTACRNQLSYSKTLRVALLCNTTQIFSCRWIGDLLRYLLYILLHERVPIVVQRLCCASPCTCTYVRWPWNCFTCYFTRLNPRLSLLWKFLWIETHLFLLSVLEIGGVDGIFRFWRKKILAKISDFFQKKIIFKIGV